MLCLEEVGVYGVDRFGNVSPRDGDMDFGGIDAVIVDDARAACAHDDDAARNR